MKRSSLILFAMPLILMSTTAGRGGDYGLTVDDSVTQGCRWKTSGSRNVCNAAVVIEDLRRFYLRGDDLRLGAVRVGLFHCSVWFAGDEERQAVYGAFADILAQPEVHSPKTLMHDVGCFPYKSMKRALERETAAGDQTPAATKRLEAAYAMIVKRYRP